MTGGTTLAGARRCRLIFAAVQGRRWTGRAGSDAIYTREDKARALVLRRHSSRVCALTLCERRWCIGVGLGANSVTAPHVSRFKMQAVWLVCCHTLSVVLLPLLRQSRYRASRK